MYSRFLSFSNNGVVLRTLDGVHCCTGKSLAALCPTCRTFLTKELPAPLVAKRSTTTTPTPSVPRAAATELPDPAPTIASVLAESSAPPTVVADAAPTIASLLAERQ
jgi:hypothetical protein